MAFNPGPVFLPASAELRDAIGGIALMASQLEAVILSLSPLVYCWSDEVQVKKLAQSRAAVKLLEDLKVTAEGSRHRTLHESVSEISELLREYLPLRVARDRWVHSIAVLPAAGGEVRYLVHARGRVTFEATPELARAVEADLLRIMMRAKRLAATLRGYPN